MSVLSLRTVRQSPIRSGALLLGLVALAGCSAGSSAAPGGQSPTPMRSSDAPSPDPRVGLSAGLHNAGQAAWNMRLVSATPSPERFASVEDAVAHARAGNPRYDDALLRHRVVHAVRPLPGGGYTWKYDRAIRDAVRAGRWRDGLDLWPLWKTLACPTVIVRGAESDILTGDIAGRMLASQPRARLVEVVGAGHTVPGDRPAEFLAALREFLDP